MSTHQPPQLPLQLLATSSPDAAVRIAIPVDTAAHGVELIVGAYLAITRHRRLGGVPVRAVWYDDHRSAAGGRAAAEQIIQGGIRYVIGHFSSRAALAAAPIYAEADALFIAPAASAPELTKLAARRNVLRLFGRDDDQAAAIAGLLRKFEPHQEVELFAEDNQYGRNVVNAVAALLTRAGLPSRILIADGSEEIPATIGPAVLAGTHEFSARLLRRLSPRRRRIVTDDAFTPAFLEESNSTAEGAFVTIFGFDAPPVEIHRLNADYFRLVGNTPGGYFLTSYAAAELILSALRKFGDCGGLGIAEHLRTSLWQTRLGHLGFEASGEVRGPSWRFVRVDQRRFVVF
jgi:branched-chain amino acid transport system substrate-binding protein